MASKKMLNDTIKSSISLKMIMAEHHFTSKIPELRTPLYNGKNPIPNYRRISTVAVVA